jgi:transposase
MPQPDRRIESVIGIDVGKKTVTIHDSLTGKTFTVANTVPALTDALTPLQDRELAVCEATGGYEDTLLCVLHSLDIPTHRGDGGKISAFARSLQRAKTDRIDARMLARYGAERGHILRRHVPVDPRLAAMAVLVRRRIDLVEARKIERTRAKGPRAQLMKGSHQRAIAFLDKEIDRLEADIAALFAKAPELAARRAALETIPGIGQATATKLVALMPELGSMCRRAAAALAAVAPHPRDSGQANPARTTAGGGRRILRPILFMAAMTAARGKNKLADFYKKLRANGKPKRLALVATMRKIVVIANARLAHAN